MQGDSMQGDRKEIPRQQMPGGRKQTAGSRLNIVDNSRQQTADRQTNRQQAGRRTPDPCVRFFLRLGMLAVLKERTGDGDALLVAGFVLALAVCAGGVLYNASSM
jgi:hypothetical protein